MIHGNTDFLTSTPRPWPPLRRIRLGNSIRRCCRSCYCPGWGGGSCTIAIAYVVANRRRKNVLDVVDNRRKRVLDVVDNRRKSVLDVVANRQKSVLDSMDVRELCTEQNLLILTFPQVYSFTPPPPRVPIKSCHQIAVSRVVQGLYGFSGYLTPCCCFSVLVCFMDCFFRIKGCVCDLSCYLSINQNVKQPSIRSVLWTTINIRVPGNT